MLPNEQDFLNSGISFEIVSYPSSHTLYINGYRHCFSSSREQIIFERDEIKAAVSRLEELGFERVALFTWAAGHTSFRMFTRP